MLGDLVLLGKETQLVGNHAWASADGARKELVFVISDVGNSGTSVEQQGLEFGNQAGLGVIFWSLLWVGNLAT